MKYDNIIAIDPDVDKSGVAYLKPKSRQLEVANLTFPQLLDYLKHAQNVRAEESETLIVLVEAGWLIQGNWHLANRETKNRAASKGYDVGRNHELGRKIVEMCKH